MAGHGDGMEHSIRIEYPGAFYYGFAEKVAATGVSPIILIF
jgi:hypothetical protein